MMARAEREQREGIIRYENLIISDYMNPLNYEILSEKRYYVVSSIGL
jgi:hypothetical protein